MDVQDIALAAGGVLGAGVAVVHGTLIQRLMVTPLTAAEGSRLSAPIRGLVAPLLHFSTFNWFLGGVVLVAVAAMGQPQARLVAGLLVGSSYLFGGLGNLWATRGKHPGWTLMALALVLIGVGLAPGA